MVGTRSGVTIRGTLFHRSIQNPGGIVTDTVGANGDWIILRSDIPSHLHVPGELYPLVLDSSAAIGDVVIFEGAGTGGQELADNGASPNLGTPDPTGPVTTQTFTVKYAMTPAEIVLTTAGGGGSPLRSSDFAVSVHGLNPDKYTVNMTGTATTLDHNATTTFTVTAQPGPYSGVIQIDSTVKAAGSVLATNTLRMNVGFPVPAGPAITAISPTSGSTAGGTSVTIMGTGFTGATGVTIGGAAATAVTVVSATSITCTTPAGTAGTNAANMLYTYVAPVSNQETVVIGGTTVLSVTNFGENRILTDLLTGQTVSTGTLSPTTTMDSITFSLPPGQAVTSGTLVVSNYVAAVPMFPTFVQENGVSYQGGSSGVAASSRISGNGTNAITVCQHELLRLSDNASHDLGPVR